MITLQQKPYLFNWSGNSIYYQLYSEAALSDPVTLFEVRVMFRLMSEPDFRILCTIPFTPLLGVVKFNLQEVLHVHLKWQVPALYAGDTIVPCDQQSGQFYILFREVNTAAPAPAWDASEASSPRIIFKGGIHLYAFKGNNFWASYYPSKKPFLTWQESGRKASRTERMYLCWINLFIVDSRSLKVRVEVTYTDLSTGSKDIAFLGHHLYVLYFIPVGVQQLGLDTLFPGKSILFWEVTVYDITVSAEAISETFRYYADNRNDYSNISFIYRNSLGGLDSIRVRGVVERSTEYSFTELNRVVKSDYFIGDVLPSVESVENAREDQIFKADLGYLGKQEQDRLRDAFLQRQIFQEVNGRWQPIKLLSKGIKLGSQKDKLFSIPIEWQLSDGGSYFYTPADVDLGGGSGSVVTNVSDTYIAGLSSSINFLGPIVKVDHTFSVQSPTGQQANTVQYKIGDGDWIDTVYPYTTPLQTTHAVNQIVQVSFRPFNFGVYGATSTITLYLFQFDFDHTVSSILNTRTAPLVYKYLINGVEVIGSTTVGAKAAHVTPLPAQPADVKLEVITDAAIGEAYSAYILSNGVITNGVSVPSQHHPFVSSVIYPNVITWEHIDLVAPYYVVIF